MSTSSGDNETWPSGVDNKTGVADLDETWSKFLRLIEPERTYEKFFSWLTRTIQMMALHKECNVSAEDVAGDTILRLLRSMSRGTEIKKDTFNAFVLRVAKNQLIDYRRHKTVDRYLSLHAVGEAKAIEPETEAHFRVGMLLKAEPDLTSEDMQMLTLLSRGFSRTEIAAELDISEQSARKRVERFRKKLRDKLSEINEKKGASHEHFGLKVTVCDIEMAANVLGLAHTVMQFPVRKSNTIALTPRFWIGGEQSFIARAQETRTALTKARLECAKATAEMGPEMTQTLLEEAKVGQALELAKSLACAKVVRVHVSANGEVADAEVSTKVTHARLGYAEIARAVSRKWEGEMMSSLASQLKAAGKFCAMPGFIAEQLRKTPAAAD